MFGRRVSGLILAASVLGGGPALADAISYRASEVIIDGLSGNLAPAGVTLPDPVAGGTVQLGELAFDNSQAPAADSTKAIRGNFSFAIQAVDAEGRALSPFVNVGGPYQGSISGGDPARWAVNLAGVATGASTPFGESVTGPLLTLLNDPGRIHILGTPDGVSGGQSLAKITLTIDPAPVPEPTTLAALLLAGGSILIRRLRRRNA